MASAASGPAYRTISDVATEIGVPQHVLRFWEAKFPQVAPMKRAGGRRYYRPADIATLATIARLLHAEGYTIKGAQRLLAEGGGAGSAPASRRPRDATNAAPIAPAAIDDGALAGVAARDTGPGGAHGLGPAQRARLAAIRADLATALAAARAL